MGLMCTGCYEKKDYFKIEATVPYHTYRVGKCDCLGEVVEIDDLCIDAIILLNKKGWTTKFCCSGHLDEGLTATYIYFEHMPNSIPMGFKRDNDKNVIRAKNIHKELTGLKGYYALLELNKKLYRWANYLPERKR